MLEDIGSLVDMLGEVQTIFSAHNEVSESTKIRQNCLVLRECKAVLFNANQPYSELAELTFSMLNYNDYGYGWMNLEFCFDMVEMYAYAPFYAGCFAIRTNNGITIKFNGHPKSRCLSKINSDNQIVVGITYYFCNEEERMRILSASKIAIEGNIAFKKKKPVYGIVCFLAKKEDGWHMEESNTLLRLDGIKITNLTH